MKTRGCFRRLIRIICCLFLFAGCSPKPVQPTVTANASDSEIQATIPEPEIDSIPSAQVYEVGFFENYEALPQLKFTPITESEFKRYRNKPYLIKQEPRETKDHFYLQTATQEHCFLKYKDYGNQLSWHGQEYMGYYPALQLFAVTEMSTSEGMGFGQLFLLDSVSNCKYSIISFGDGSVELPVPSKNNAYLVYYYNYIHEQKHAHIAVLKVNDKRHPASYLKEVASFDSQDFAVEAVVWVSDHSFLLKGYQEVYRNETWEKDYSYYQCHFK